MHKLKILIWFGFFFDDFIFILIHFSWNYIYFSNKKQYSQEFISNLKGSDDISKLLKIIEVTLQDNSIIQDYKDLYIEDKLPTVKALRSFAKTEDWDKWTEQRNIPPGIIGIIEDIFEKKEELEKEQKRKQEELEKEQIRKPEELEKG